MREVKVLSIIRTDGGTQARAGLDEARVAEYAERMKEGDQFPPLTAFYDGTDYWLADGFHRHAAALRADKNTYLVDVKQGTRRDAVLHAVGANADHGLQRTDGDKRRAVETLLRDDEWVKWSDREIAKRCKVSHPFVAKIRAEILTGNVSSEERTYTTRHGTTATMDTSRIGTAPRSPLERGIAANVDGAVYESIPAQESEPYFPALPKDAPQLTGEKNTVEARLFSALHCYDDSGQRWQGHREKGLTNDEMRTAIGREFGDGHGASGPGLVPYYAKGRTNPQFWHNANVPSSHANKPTLQGVALIDLARQVLQIPFPAPAAVLNSEQAEPTPKPRIASFVMGYFQAANEAIARIATAIPKARTDDIHDMMTIIASLERMERRVGSEYDMS